MQVDLLKDIVSSVAGDKAKGIVELLIDKKNVNEFLIAKKLNLTINQTRNILYKLADDGLVGFVRKKDSKKGGWYIYFWTLNHGRSLAKFKETLQKNIDSLKSNLVIKKNGRFYHCLNCGVEHNEEASLNYDYTCPECGEVLELKDSSKEIASLEKEITKSEALLKEVEVEISSIHQKEDKIKFRKLKAEEKKKSVERALKRKKKEREKARMEKKSKHKKGSKKSGKKSSKKR